MFAWPLSDLHHRKYLQLHWIIDLTWIQIQQIIPDAWTRFLSSKVFWALMWLKMACLGNACWFLVSPTLVTKNRNVTKYRIFVWFILSKFVFIKFSISNIFGDIAVFQHWHSVQRGISPPIIFYHPPPPPNLGIPPLLWKMQGCRGNLIDVMVAQLYHIVVFSLSMYIYFHAAIFPTEVLLIE